MSLRSNLRAFATGTPPAAPGPAATRLTGTDLVAQSAPGLARTLAGGRITVQDQIYAPAFPYIAQPTDNEDAWHLLDFDANALRKSSPAHLLRVLADVSPDVSRALWDFGRLCNPSWTVRVTRTPTSRSVYLRGQQALDGFIYQLGVLHGTINTFYAKLFIQAFLRGAFFAELILDQDGLAPIDIALPDPLSARFRRQCDPVRGAYWQLGQWQRNRFVVLDRPTVIYVPIDPIGEPPYGRPIASSALFTTLFLVGLLHDLRRVVAMQGYPRIDLELSLEKLATQIPVEIEGNDKKIKAWLDDIITEIKHIYSHLQPEDAYVHTDVLSVKQPVGTLNASSLSMVDGLIQALERMACRALKTMPIMMGLSDSISESNANRQWEIMQAGIRALQGICADLLEREFAFALQAMGIAGYVTVTFGELRAAEALRDQQIQTLRDQHALFAWQMGWIDPNEAANLAVGHDPVLQEPLAIPGHSPVAGGTVNFAQTSPESETGRAVALAQLARLQMTDPTLTPPLVGTNGHTH